METRSIATETPPDALAIEEASSRLSEFTERANFHRIETERFERCARAEAARLHTLQNGLDVRTTSPDEVMQEVGAPVTSGQLAGSPR